MTRLIEKNETFSLYDVVIVPDYQASCKLYLKEKGSSASYLLNPLHMIYTSFATLVTNLLALSAKITLRSMLTSMMGSSTVTSIDEDDFLYVSCTKNTTIYLAQDQPILAQGNATCSKTDTCIRKFTIATVQETNLFLLTVDSNCGKCKEGEMENLPGIPGKYKDIVFRGAGSYTKPPQREKIRRYPSKCYPPDKENNKHCGAANATLSMSSLLLLITLLVSYTTNS